MFKASLLATTAAALAAAALAPAAASADWSAPVTLSSADEASPSAQGAFGGSVLGGSLKPVATLSKGLGRPVPITKADPYERVWWSGLDRDGNAVVLTLRRHKPVQRVRAIFVAADATRSRTRTISDPSHSATMPALSVAPDGTAVAAWAWHDPAGWRAQVAIRRPGQPRFDKPQLVSPPARKIGSSKPRPYVVVAAGEGGRAVVAWQVNTRSGAPLHVVTAGEDSTFGPPQDLVGARGFAEVAPAVAPSGEVVVAYIGRRGGSGSSLRVATGMAGAPLADPVVVAGGGPGTTSGPQVAAAFSDDGTATVAWARPGREYEVGGALQAFTRAPGATAFGPPQTLADPAQGVVLAGGPGASAALAWMADPPGAVRWATYAALRPRAGGPFGAATAISARSSNALWPSIAITPDGTAVVAWVTNTSGGGSGNPTAARAPVG
jgi:hypothetical protein